MNILIVKLKATGDLARTTTFLRRLGHLIYLFWNNDSLAEFKRRCGFEPVRVPRYWVPLTWKGRLLPALRLRLGLKAKIHGQPSG